LWGIALSEATVSTTVRRTALVCAVVCLGLAMISFGLRWTSPRPAKANRAAEGERFVSRETPLQFPPNPIGAVCTDEELLDVLSSVEPHFNTKPTHNRITLGCLLHGLRLWGRESRFTPKSSRNVRTISGEEMVQVLLDDPSYRRTSEILGADLLQKSAVGVRVITVGDFSYGSMEASTHFGALLQVLAETGVPATESVLTADGYRGVVSDIAADDASRVVLGVELEWAAAGLGRYAACTSWTNRFHKTVSFDWIASELVRRKAGAGTCCGTHVPAALNTLLLVHEREEILSAAAHADVLERLREYAECLQEAQTAEGAWLWEWADAMPDGVVPRRHPIYQLDSVATMVVTGHHLEWMAFAPDDRRPPPEKIRAAARYLVDHWPDYRQHLRRDWHLYGPVTHAASAVWLLNGKDGTPAAFVMDALDQEEEEEDPIVGRSA